ncbi:hypothetical protein [Rhodoferax sp.]|nr:hypothetical protein [Rhodoferax sp.]
MFDFSQWKTSPWQLGSEIHKERLNVRLTIACQRTRPIFQESTG